MIRETMPGVAEPNVPAMESDRWPVSIEGIFAEECSREVMNDFAEWLGKIDSLGPCRHATDFQRRTITLAFPLDVGDEVVRWWLELLHRQNRLLPIVRHIEST
jgi:hypothetical protein